MRIILILLFIGNILIASIDKENNANFQKVYDKSELFLKDKFKDIATLRNGKINLNYKSLFYKSYQSRKSVQELKKIENNFIKKYGKKNVNKLKKINLNSYSNFLVKKSFKDINIKVLYKIFTNTEINKVLFYSKTIVGGSSNSFLAAFMKAFFKNHYKIDKNKVLEISKKYCNCNLDNKKVKLYKLSENQIISVLELSKGINFISELKVLKGKEFYWLESEFIDNKDNRKVRNSFKIAIDSFSAKVLFLYWEKISN